MNQSGRLQDDLNHHSDREGRPIMTLQTFRELLSRRPFQPFRIVTLTGRTYDVRHPEMAFLTDASIFIATVGAEEGAPLGFMFCMPHHVARIELLGARSSEPRQTGPA